MARRYVNPKRDAGDVPDDFPSLAEMADAVRRRNADRLLALGAGPFPAGLARAGDVPAPRLRPGSWRNCLYRAHAPGAKLNDIPEAASLGRFMAAVARNALGERVPSDGGFLVPEILRSDMLVSAVEQAIVRPRAMVFEMSALREGFPLLDGTSQASGAVGGLTFSFTESGASIPATSAKTGRAMFEARKLAALLLDVPDELIEDAGPAWDAFIETVVPAGYAYSEDHYFIRGTGAGEPAGALNASCAISVTRAGAGAVSLADVAAMRKRMHPQAIRSRRATWLANSETVGQLAELSGGGSGTTYPPTSGMGLGIGPDGGWRLAGLKLIETNHASALGSGGDLILADFGLFAIGDRQLLTAERSRMGATFKAYASDVKIKARLDGRWLLGQPVTPDQGETVSAVVVLD